MHSALTVLLQVEARTSLEVSNGGRGYFQQLGITALSTQQLVELAREFLKNDPQSDLVKVVETWEPDFEGDDAEIRDLCTDVSSVGVWYFSGRAWFDDDEED
jgi:hypothetical protein